MNPKFKLYLLAIGLTLSLIPGGSIAQERQFKPVTHASLVRSLLTLSDKASRSGLPTAAARIDKLAAELLGLREEVKK